MYVVETAVDDVVLLVELVAEVVVDVEVSDVEVSDPVVVEVGGV